MHVVRWYFHLPLVLPLSLLVLVNRLAHMVRSEAALYTPIFIHKPYIFEQNRPLFSLLLHFISYDKSPDLAQCPHSFCLWLQSCTHAAMAVPHTHTLWNTRQSCDIDNPPLSLWRPPIITLLFASFSPLIFPGFRFTLRQAKHIVLLALATIYNHTAAIQTRHRSHICSIPV